MNKAMYDICSIMAEAYARKAPQSLSALARVISRYLNISHRLAITIVPTVLGSEEFQIYLELDKQCEIIQGQVSLAPTQLYDQYEDLLDTFK